jgi:integrase/recombinase XerC
MKQAKIEIMARKFLDYLSIEKGYSKHTINNYRYDLNRLSRYLERNETPINQVTLLTLRSYLQYLKETVGLGNRSLARSVSSLKGLFSFLEEEGDLKSNPSVKLSVPKTRSTLPDHLSAREMEKLINSIIVQDDEIGLRNMAMIEIMYASGIRVSELVNIKIKNIDLDNMTMRVLGKRNRERMVLINESATAAIKRYMKIRKGLTDNEYLFIGKKTRRKLTTRTVQVLLQKISSIFEGTRKVTPHMLRHTFATHMLTGGADLRTIQELLGHVNMATTQIYTDLNIDTKKNVYKESHPRDKLTVKE